MRTKLKFWIDLHSLWVQIQMKVSGVYIKLKLSENKMDKLNLYGDCYIDTLVSMPYGCQTIREEEREWENMILV